MLKSKIKSFIDYKILLKGIKDFNEYEDIPSS